MLFQSCNSNFFFEISNTSTGMAPTYGLPRRPWKAVTNIPPWESSWSVARRPLPWPVTPAAPPLSGSSILLSRATMAMLCSSLPRASTELSTPPYATIPPGSRSSPVPPVMESIIVHRLSGCQLHGWKFCLHAWGSSHLSSYLVHYQQVGLSWNKWQRWTTRTIGDDEQYLLQQRILHVLFTNIVTSNLGWLRFL